MTVQKVKNDASAIYKKNENSYWVLGLACGLLMGATFALAVTVNALLLIIVPFVVVPIFFACHCAFLAIQANEKITFKKALDFFIMYFKNPFNSSFSFMKAFFKSLLIFILGFFVFSMAAYGITNAVDPSGLTSLVNELDALLRQSTYTIEQVNAILNKYSSVVTLLTYLSILPATFFTFMFFTYFVSENSLSVYYRLSCTIIDATLLNAVNKALRTKFRKDFLKVYFGINWPLFILLAVGFGGGIATSLAINRDASFASTLACAMGLAAASFFFPFYFPNMQAMYENFSPLYQQATMEVTNEIIKRAREAGLKQDNDTQSEIVDVNINPDDNNDQND